MGERKQDAWDTTTAEIAELLRKKQADYGPHNILGTRYLGLAVRLNDKIQRLLNLLRKQGVTLDTVSLDDSPNFEGIRDTFMDIAGYGTIGVMLLDGTFNEEL